jgi:hypothetical protein
VRESRTWRGVLDLRGESQVRAGSARPDASTHTAHQPSIRVLLLQGRITLEAHWMPLLSQGG